jgi:tagaturonate reductase
LSSRPTLNRRLFPGAAAHPERVLQFGEGNFLRAFVDWQIDGMNRKGLFQSGVLVVQPIEKGKVGILNGQDGLYTLIERGLEEGKPLERREMISVIRRGLDPYKQWDLYMESARRPEVRFVFSNTTEAGIDYVPVPFPDGVCPAPFPAKLAAFLYERYRHFGGAAGRGLLVFPCELIEGNGRVLKDCLVRHARDWGLGGGFLEWLDRNNHFYDTLVDRIVSGYPSVEAETLQTELGYEDALMVCSELHHFWAIQGDPAARRELPLTEASFNVRWTEDLTPFRLLKVRILNGAHTLVAIPALLAGRETVGQCIRDPLAASFLRTAIYGEVLPALDMPESEKKSYAGSVFERLANPFLEHRLTAIALNAVSKFRVRVLPSLLAYRERTGGVPALCSFSLAALIAFYKSTRAEVFASPRQAPAKSPAAEDEPKVLAKFARAHGSSDPAAVCREILEDGELWGFDLGSVPGLVDRVILSYGEILTRGMEEAMRRSVAAGEPT